MSNTGRPRWQWCSVVFLLGLSVSSCFFQDDTRDQSKSPPASQEELAASPIQKLTLIKNDPHTGDHWSATLTHASGAEPLDWRVTSSDRGTLIDNRADGNFVLHLLDTLQTIKNIGPAPHGPPESFGLNPPWFAVRMESTTGTPREIRLALPEPGKPPVYAQFPDQSSDSVVLAEGAAIQMLKFIENFEVIRQRTLLSITPDDVDELILKKKGKEYFYAQRDGVKWTNRQHHPVATAVNELLEALTHARVQQFLDQVDENRKLATAADHEPPYEAIFAGRKGKPVTLRLAWLDSRFVVTVSSRPGVAFIAYPALATYFETR